ncbi:MAG: hypothetical protein ACRENP_26775, partial [Longimicrobiales bacterium]
MTEARRHETHDVQLVPGEGDRGHFTREEVRLALEAIRRLTSSSNWDPKHEADLIYDGDPAFGFVFDEYLLSALAIVSDDLFERVRHLIGETYDETKQ